MNPEQKPKNDLTKEQYLQLCLFFKKKLSATKKENDESQSKLYHAERETKKIQLERAVLLQRLESGSSPGSPEPSSPCPSSPCQSSPEPGSPKPGWPFSSLPSSSFMLPYPSLPYPSSPSSSSASSSTVSSKWFSPSLPSRSLPNPSSSNAARPCAPATSRQGGTNVLFSNEQTTIMRDYYLAHMKNDDKSCLLDANQKKHLASATGLTERQIVKWFAKARSEGKPAKWEAGETTARHTDEQTTIMRTYFVDHMDKDYNCYPDAAKKVALADQTGLTTKQVAAWFSLSSTRNRYKLWVENGLVPASNDTQESTTAETDVEEGKENDGMENEAKEDKGKENGAKENEDR